MKGLIIAYFLGVLVGDMTSSIKNIDIIKYDVYGMRSSPTRDSLIWSNVDRKLADEWIHWACNEHKYYKACIKVIRD